MARSGRMSVFLSDTSRAGDDEVPLSPAEQGRLTRDVASSQKWPDLM